MTVSKLDLDWMGSLAEGMDATSPLPPCDALFNHGAALLESGLVELEGNKAAHVFGFTRNKPALSIGVRQFRSTLVSRCHPWARKGKGWGWSALALCAQEGDGALIEELLSQPLAPEASEIVEKKVSVRSIKGGNSESLPLWWAALTEENRLDAPRIAQVIHAFKKRGVSFEKILQAHDASIGTPSLAAFEALLEEDVSPATRYGTTFLLPEILQSQRNWNALQDILRACIQRSQTSPSWREEIGKVWAEVLTAFSTVATRLDLRGPHKEATVELLGQLADLSGLMLTSNQSGVVNLWGCLAKSLVEKAAQSSAFTNSRIPTWNDITAKTSSRHRWTGEIEPGIPDGAWALFGEAQKQAYQGSPPSRAAVDVYIASDVQRFWAGMTQLHQRYAENALAWKACAMLKNSCPKPLWPNLRHISLQGFVRIHEQKQCGNSNDDAAKLLVSTCDSFLRTVAEGAFDEAHKEMVNLALRAHVIRGFNSSLAQGALARISRDNPAYLDVDGFTHTLNTCTIDLPHELKTRVQEALLSCTTSAARPLPRPRF